MYSGFRTKEDVERCLTETDGDKQFRSPDYNYNFDKATGLFERWGRTESDDPPFAPSPEILDLEISVGGCPSGCDFCYKGNTNEPPTNMTLDEFKLILSKFPRSLTQIAFGITGVQTNPDFIPMMRHCREQGVIPNFTLTGIDLTDDLAKEISGLVGALAVSVHPKDKQVGYNTVKKFVALGMKQVNIHLLTSLESADFTKEVLKDIQEDKDLAKLNAVVFLGVKPKGRAKDHYHPVSQAWYQNLVIHCLVHKIPFGFDSCSAPMFEATVRKVITSPEARDSLLAMSESCESSLFSSYVNVKGEYWNCSFCENEDGIRPVSVMDSVDFIQDVWLSEEVVEFRNKLLATEKDGCRHCFVYDLDG